MKVSTISAIQAAMANMPTDQVQDLKDRLKEVQENPMSVEDWKLLREDLTKTTAELITTLEAIEGFE